MALKMLVINHFSGPRKATRLACAHMYMSRKLANKIIFGVVVHQHHHHHQVHPI